MDDLNLRLKKTAREFVTDKQTLKGTYIVKQKQF